MKFKKLLSNKKFILLLILFCAWITYLCTINPSATLEFFRILPVIISSII